MLQFQLNGVDYDNLIVMAEELTQNRTFTSRTTFIPVMWGTDNERMLLERAFLRLYVNDGIVYRDEVLMALEVFELMEAHPLEELVKCIAIARQHKLHSANLPSMRDIMLERWRVATVRCIVNYHFLSIEGKEWIYELAADA